MTRPRSSLRSACLAGALAVVALTPGSASAQASLSGTFIEYFTVGAEGAPYDGTQSMRWRTTGLTPATCDLYAPGTPVSSFTVAFTHGGATLVATNGASSDGEGTAQIATTAPTSASGRRITWAGEVQDGAARLAVRLAYFVPSGQHHVTATVELENTGAEALTDVYFLFNGDPDQGFCSPAADRDNANDVVRQPPADRSALATSSIGALALRPAATVALGAFDLRARASNLGFYNEDPASLHAAPGDGEGAMIDVSHSIVFRHPALALGALTTMRFAWVWAGDVSTAAARFDALECALAGDGGACVGAGAAPGTCRAGACCTGCWDGASCQAGLLAAECGAGGGACADCDDGQSCTDDVCSAGACDSAPLPGFCFAAGQCIVEGADNPANDCEVCAPLANPLGFSPKASGAPCDDGAFCTDGDMCDGASACGSSPRVCPESDACDSPMCDEAGDQCVGARQDGCAIDGACVAAGTPDPASLCRVCDPAQALDAYSPRPAGTSCGAPSCAAGVLTPAASCDASGECVVPPDFDCPGTGACAADAMSCEGGCAIDAHCPQEQHCEAEECVPDEELGEGCARDAQCPGGQCVDGVCCDAACDGVCESCALAATRGACAPVSDGDDPEGECGGLACDGAGACRQPDAGLAADAGRTDAGGPDAGAMDGGGTDAAPDAGARALVGGGLCSVEPASPSRRAPLGLLVLGLLVAWRVRRRA